MKKYAWLVLLALTLTACQPNAEPEDNVQTSTEAATSDEASQTADEARASSSEEKDEDPQGMTDEVPDYLKGLYVNLEGEPFESKIYTAVTINDRFFTYGGPLGVVQVNELTYVDRYRKLVELHGREVDPITAEVQEDSRAIQTLKIEDEDENGRPIFKLTTATYYPVDEATFIDLMAEYNGIDLQTTDYDPRALGSLEDLLGYYVAFEDEVLNSPATEVIRLTPVYFQIAVSDDVERSGQIYDVKEDEDKIAYQVYLQEESAPVNAYQAETFEFQVSQEEGRHVLKDNDKTYYQLTEEEYKNYMKDHGFSSENN